MDEPTASRPRAPRRMRWIAGISLICVGIGGLAAWAIASPGAVSYYATPSEILAQGDKASERLLRLGGHVADGTLVREGTRVRFAVTDGRNEIPVVYTGEVPDTLKERTDVIAEGTLSRTGTLIATRVLAKCSSKFVPAQDAPEHLRRG